MNIKSIDHLLWGFLIATAAAILFFIGYAYFFILIKGYNWTLDYFYNSVFLNMKVIKIGTIPVFGQMLVFYILNQRGWVYAARGTMLSILAVTIYLVMRWIYF